ncbi:MAG: ABC transporter permease [Eubacteriales bacterium]|nr:ABC transporter permease [Eubacteriales bacterium]
MRFFNLLKNELRFTVKYGILLLYIILTAFYVVALSVIPENARQATGAVLIFTDPAAMGLFFMGAVMLLEKSQRVNHAIFVSPVKIDEYITVKALSMLIVGTAAGAVIGIAGGANIVGAVLSVALSSFLFSLCAIIVAVKTGSLNSFLLSVVPMEIVIFVPALLYLFGAVKSGLWVLHPGVSSIILLTEEQSLWVCCVISLCLWNAAAFLLCRKAAVKYMCQLGGGKL